jgi:hypothetical protein
MNLGHHLEPQNAEERSEEHQHQHWQTTTSCIQYTIAVRLVLCHGYNNGHAEFRVNWSGLNTLGTRLDSLSGWVASGLKVNERAKPGTHTGPNRMYSVAHVSW